MIEIRELSVDYPTEDGKENAIANVSLTVPKGTVLPEVGNALLKHGYRIKIFNTINFKKSMHYNPFAYVHDEKDILKLVTTLS